jgi:hypothetical protein
MGDDKLEFYWPSTGTLTIRLLGNDSATLQFKPSAAAVKDGIRKAAVEPAYGDFAEKHPNTHGK